MVISRRPAPALVAALDLVLPSECAGCGAPGVGLCDSCRAEVVAAVLPVAPVAPSPVPPGWPGCRAVLSYDGVVARLVRGAKDGARRDLLPVLGRLLSDAVGHACLDLATAAVSDVADVGVRPGIWLVPAPSARATRRRRGDSPVETMTREAARVLGGEARVVPALQMVRRVRDQAELGGRDRHANLAGAMAIAHGTSVAGRSCVVVDDVVTSGATMVEALRVLRAAGARQVALAALCATPRRGPVLPSRGGLT